MISFKKIDNQDILYFNSLLSKEHVSINEEDIERCSSDHTEDFVFAPEVVLTPTSTEQVSEILKWCNAKNIAVTPRGAGTGLSGGALPIYGGVCLDMRRMNKIIKIDTENFQVVTEPGVITEVLQNAVVEHGLFYPVDPASKGSCFIGGNVAENSGGPRAVKYGVVKDYVLNLEIVLADGTIMWTGANTLKNATGYNITQLMIGSEGTLGIVTKIVLKLIPNPTGNLLLLVPFLDAKDAAKAVNTIMLAGYNPSALEFMERDALVCAQSYLGSVAVNIPEEIQAHLLIEVDGNDKELLFVQMEGIANLLAQYRTGDMLFAENAQQKSELWRLRRVVGEAVKNGSIYKEEDTVVPRSYLPNLLDKVKSIGNKYGFTSVCYGHAGDGNLHVNIIKGTLDEETWVHKLPIAIREIFEFVHSVGGTISGEHGIGFVQKNYLDIVFSEAQLSLMSQIKSVFDTKGILNPGKAI